MNTTVISGRLVRNPGYNEVENEKGLHKIAKFVLAVRRRKNGMTSGAQHQRSKRTESGNHQVS